MLTKKIRQKDRVIENGKWKIDNEVQAVQKFVTRLQMGKLLIDN